MRCSINWVACFDEIAPCVIFHVVCKSVSVRSLHRMAGWRSGWRGAVQSAESPSVALRKVTRNHNESEARKKLPRQWSGQAQAPRKNAKLGQAKEERQDKYLHFRLGFRRSHGRDAGRRGSSPRVRAGIGVKSSQVYT
jgi:hypothetical protein